MIEIERILCPVDPAAADARQTRNPSAPAAERER